MTRRLVRWPPRRVIALWALVVGGTVVLTAVLDLVGAPSASLFAGLLCGLAVAIGQPTRLLLPRPVTTAAFAITGAVVGVLIDMRILRTVAADWAPVTLSMLGTLLITVAGGLVLARFTPLDRPTSVFGVIAGGASGVIALSGDAGADARIVAVMQYLRVLLVLLAMPLVTVLVPAPGGTAPAGPQADPLAGLAFAAVVSLAGIGLARVVRLSSGVLLGPMLLAAGVALLAPSLAYPVPDLLQEVAFAVIGMQVGLRFQAGQLRLLARIVPAVLGTMVGLIALCAAMAALLSGWTGRPLLDWYLATTPGGLYAVLAAALQTGADAPFVTAVQVLRLFTMLLAAPLLAWYLRRGRSGAGRTGQR